MHCTVTEPFSRTTESTTQASVHVEGVVAVITLLCNELDFEAAQAIGPRVRQLIEGRAAVILDVAQIGYADSVGLESLLDIVRGFPGKVVLAGASRPLRDLLDLAQLRDVIRVFEDARAALAAFDLASGTYREQHRTGEIAPPR